MATAAPLENAVTDIGSLLLPVAKGNLLLPNVAVAEVISNMPTTILAEAAPWYLGHIEWREQQVPLLCYETLNYEQPADDTSHSRIAVLNCTGQKGDLFFIAIRLQGVPKLLRVTAPDIRENEDEEIGPMDLMAINCFGETAVIPNITALEQSWIEHAA